MQKFKRRKGVRKTTQYDRNVVTTKQQTMLHIASQTSNIQERGTSKSMTTLGLQWLEHQEKKRSNQAQERLKAYEIGSKESIAAQDRESKENVASLDRQSKENISTLDRNSKEYLTTLEQNIKKELTQAQLTNAMDIARLNADLQEYIAVLNDQAKRLDREQAKAINDAKLDLEKYLGLLKVAPNAVQNTEAQYALGYDDWASDILSGFESAFEIIGSFIGGKINLN